MFGCQYVGDVSGMKDHLRKCTFVEKYKKIKCQDILCKKEVPMREMVQHMKDVHKSLEETADSSGKIMSVGRFAEAFIVNEATWPPRICSYNNQTFFLHANLYEKVWTFWVSALGNKDEAKKYEVELRIPKTEGHNFDMGYRGKVFSSDEHVLSVVNDRDNVLRLDNNLAEVREDGSFKFTVDYQIICE